MTIEIKNLQCISTLLANYADKIISINEGSSSNNRIESLIESAKKNGVKTISSKGDFSAICKQPVIRDIKDKDLDFGEVVLVSRIHFFIWKLHQIHFVFLLILLGY